MNPVPSINFQITFRADPPETDWAALGKPTILKLIDFTREEKED